MHENTNSALLPHNFPPIYDPPQRPSPSIKSTIETSPKLAAHHIALQYIIQRRKEQKDLDDDDDLDDIFFDSFILDKPQNKTNTEKHGNNSSQHIDNIPIKALQLPSPSINKSNEHDRTGYSNTSDSNKRRKISQSSSYTNLEDSFGPLKQVSPVELYPKSSLTKISHTEESESTASIKEAPVNQEIRRWLKHGGVQPIPPFKPKEQHGTSKTEQESKYQMENARSIPSQSVDKSDLLQHINKPRPSISSEMNSAVKKIDSNHHTPKPRALATVDANRLNKPHEPSDKRASQPTDLKDEPLLTGEILIKGKPYVILNKISHGGSCTVYRILHEKTQVHHALKHINTKNLKSDAINELKTEVALLSGFNKKGSTYVPKMFNYEHNRLTGTIDIVLELGAKDFAYVLKERRAKPLNMNFVRFYGQQILEAIAEIHSYNVLHRDIKPANLIIKDDSLKLIDYGIAKQLKDSKRMVFVETPVGTISYMPPEAFIDTRNKMIKHSHIGLSCDIWAFGCILYQMIYGQTPFHNIPADKKMYHIIDHQSIDFPTVVTFSSPTGADIHTNVSETALALLKICLHRNPLGRQSAKTLLEHPFFHPVN